MAAKKPRVLIIDDEVGLTAILKMSFEQNGFDVSTAHDGRQGLLLLKEDHPDLVVADMMMPEVDGFQFFKELKADNMTSNIPVIFLTARTAMQDSLESMGVDAFFPKPVAFEILLEKVRSLVTKQALVLCDDSAVIDEITGIYKRHGHKVCIARDEDSFMRQARTEKYDFIVAYLCIVKRSPSDFAKAIRDSISGNASIVIYCDDQVVGTENDNDYAIINLKALWKAAGIETFYDKRLDKADFSEIGRAHV